jgi:H+/gluconate symporter-like permease
MTGNNREDSWPTAAVAISIAALVGLVTIVAILKYDVDEALMIWSALGTIVGALTGAIVTYYFARKTVAAEKAHTATAKTEANRANSQATQANTEAKAVRALADDRLRMLVRTAGVVDSVMWKSTLENDPDLQRVLKAG